MDVFFDLAAHNFAPDMSAEERAIALARWVAANGTNDHRRKNPDGAPFFSLCGLRATVFEQLARRAGLEVRRVALDDFAGSGHSAAEVRYDGAWHFFDVTYAGYFRVNGTILSFDEIQADPQRALRGLVVFEGTLDLWSDGKPVDNVDRMRRNYTPENLRAARRQPPAAGGQAQSGRVGSPAS